MWLKNKSTLPTLVALVLLALILTITLAFSADEVIRHDANTVPVGASVTNDTNKYITQRRVNGINFGELTDNADSQQTTYSYASGTNAVIAGDNIQIQGSASVKLYFSEIDCYVDTTAALAASGGTISLTRHSTGDSGGTSSSGTVAKFDTGDGASGATVLLYSVAPTAGTTVATIASAPFTDEVGNQAIVFNQFGRYGKRLILNGTGDYLVVNSSAAPASTNLNCTAIWVER